MSHFQCRKMSKFWRFFMPKNAKISCYSERLREATGAMWGGVAFVPRPRQNNDR
jgi:hypothetical protein